MKRILLLLALALPAFAQEYAATEQVTLAGAAEAFTVQQPATGARQVRFRGAYVACSAACTITLERNGTAATTTSATPAQINPDLASPSKAVAFTGSNVGVGTVIANYGIAAGGFITIDLTGMRFIGNGTGQNLTLRTNSITGTVQFVIKFQEVTQ